MESFTLKDIIEALKKDPDGDFNKDHLNYLGKGPRITNQGILTISLFPSPSPHWTDVEKLHKFNGRVMKHKGLEYICYYDGCILWFELI